MKMSKLSNQTNSQDPQAVNSRIFVGNLNTFQCSKTDVERMFQRYGRLAGKIVYLIKLSTFFSTETWERVIIAWLGCINMHLIGIKKSSLHANKEEKEERIYFYYCSTISCMSFRLFTSFIGHVTRDDQLVQNKIKITWETTFIILSLVFFTQIN